VDALELVELAVHGMQRGHCRSHLFILEEFRRFRGDFRPGRGLPGADPGHDDGEDDEHRNQQPHPEEPEPGARLLPARCPTDGGECCEGRHSGMFPCFLAGSDCRFPASISSARINRNLVVEGMITSST